MRLERAQRLERLYRSRLDREQRDYVLIRQEQERVQGKLEDLVLEKEKVATRRNHSTLGADWRMWQAYVDWLEDRICDQRHQVDRLRQEAELLWAATQESRREARRYSRIVEKAQIMAQRESFHKDLRLLDELAGRGHWTRRVGGVNM